MNVCSPKWIKMVQLPYIRRVIMNCHYLGKLQYAPVLRVAAESWVAHMVCCGWYLCASLQTAVPSLGRGEDDEIWGDLDFRMGKCRRILLKMPL